MRGLVLSAGCLAIVSLAMPQASALAGAVEPSVVPSPVTGRIAPPAGVARATDYAEGRVIVRFRAGLAPARMQRAAGAIGHSPGRRLDRRGYRVLELEADASVEAALFALNAEPDVAHAQPDFLYRPVTVNGPAFDQLWGLHNTGQRVTDPTLGELPTLHESNPGVAGADINALAAWEVLSDCSDVVVAVLDEGVNYLHEDLAANMWPGAAHHGRDFVDGTPTPEDPFPQRALEYHGTHVAGTIGAVGDNGTGMTGVCRKAELMALRVCGRDGCPTSAIIQALDYAVDNGARLINMSLGGRASDPALEAAVADAGEADAMIVAAAGNESEELTAFDSPPFNPCALSASFPHVLCVASIDQNDQLSSFSNFGDHSVNIAAPGRNILSSWVGQAELLLEDASAWQHAAGGEWAVDACRWLLLESELEITLPTLMNPEEPSPPDCSFDEFYLPDADQRVWRTQDTVADGTLDQWLLLQAPLFDLASGDVLRLAGHTGTGDPFVEVGNVLGVLDSSAPDAFILRASLAPAGCARETCTVGFQLDSDAGETGTGIAMADMRIEALQEGTTAHRMLRGTSMAAPHATGVAALVRAFSPGFSAADTRRALTESGRDVAALGGSITSSGRVVDARAALEWIDPPGTPNVELLTEDGDAAQQ